MSFCNCFSGLKFGLLVAVVCILMSIDSIVYCSTPAPVAETIPAPLIFLEPDNNNIVIVEKSSQQLFLFNYNGGYKKKLSMECSTGKVSGSKLKSGDKKTPEGIYFCTNEFTKRDLSPIYGARAFPIDYPNWLDRVAGKNGNAIWIHGTNKKLKERDSNGCIALNNPDINRLADYISLNRTPVILVEKLRYVPKDSVLEIKTAIRDFLEKWCQSFKGNSFIDHVEYYEAGFTHENDWWNDWVTVRDTLFALNNTFETGMKNISVYRHSGTYVALFDQVVHLAEKSYTIGTRKMFLKEVKDGFRIIGDEFQTHNNEESPVFTLHQKPLVAFSLSLEKELRNQIEIIDMVENWRRAWASKNLVAYGNYYAENFNSNGMDRSAWLRHKRALNKKYEYIDVMIDDLSISKGQKRSVVTFVQTYKSNKLCDIGSKKLVLKLEGGKWKIMREIWKKS